MTDLIEARQKFAAEWRDLQSSMQKETGLDSRWSSHWVWPALALAAGVAAGAGLLWRRSRKG